MKAKNIKETLKEIESGTRVILNKYTSVRKISLSSGAVWYESMTYPKQEDEYDMSKGIRSKKYTDYNKFKNAVKRYIKINQ
tara:strand:- start:1005 stop:1247 length:243 start_codon:yes stop_codon:yes gene_type:complete